MEEGFIIWSIIHIPILNIMNMYKCTFDFVIMGYNNHLLIIIRSKHTYIKDYKIFKQRISLTLNVRLVCVWIQFNTHEMNQNQWEFFYFKSIYTYEL